MQTIVANSASDAVQNLTDAVTKGNLTGWDLVAVAAVLVLSIPVAHLAARATRRAIGQVTGMSDELGNDLGRVAKGVVYLLGLAVSLSILGVTVGFVSILFGFALVLGALMLKPMVENSAAGMLLVARPSFSVGDQIRSTEFRGVVEQIGSRSTTLRASNGVLIHISNNQVLSNPIVVYSASDSRKASFDIGVPSDTDLDAVTSTLMTAVASVEDVPTKPAPQIEATGLADNEITLSISFWYPSTMTTDSGVTDRVIRATKSALAGADIMLTGPSVRVTESSDVSAKSDTSVEPEKDGVSGKESDGGKN
jgi:small conductance mechanosensitive channel